MHILKSIRRLLAASLALVMALSLTAPALAVVTSFGDVPASHSFHDAIMWSASQGIVGGYNDGTFQPSKTVSRSNFSVMLSRAFYAADVATNQTQPIYTEKGTFYPNYMALYLNGIYKGTDMAGKAALQSADTMNTGISRYEMAQLMTNIMKQKGFAASDAEKSAVISKIADYNAIPSQFQDAVANVYALGIIGGYADGSFSGSGIMNRGQACVVIYRMMQYSGGAGTTAPETPVTPAEPAPKTPAEPVAVTTGKLSDGSEATEANVMRLLEEAYQAKAGTPWGATGSANGYNQGTSSALYATITNGPRKGYGTGLKVSVQGGCGGFAAYMSDYVFSQKASIRETTLDKMRAGDIIVTLYDNQIDHVQIYCGHNGIVGKNEVAYGAYTANAGTNPEHTSDKVWNPNNGIYKANSTTGQSYVIYTRYPDSGSGNTSSGSVTTPVPEAPSKPVATTAGTLSDGSEATEANVMRLLEEAYQAVAGTAWGTPSTSTGQSTSAAYPNGNNSALYNTLTNGKYRTIHGGKESVISGCGGFAAYMSDYVFGQKAAVRETTLDKIRAGDVIVELYDNQISHVSVYCGHNGTTGNINGERVTAYGQYTANAGTNPEHTSSTVLNLNNGIYKANSTTGQSYVIYTRYPD